MISKKSVLLLFIGTLLTPWGYSQHAVMIHEGEIEFEKSVNTHAILKKYYSDEGSGSIEFAEQYRKEHPQFKVVKFKLQFNDTASYYTPQPSEENVADPFLSAFAGTNTVFTNLNNKTSVSQKNVFGEQVVIVDSVRSVQWKITNEIKEIAGFSCRRANALIMDSVYVVAFFSDEIVPKGGPESFIGLPGMILGLALPHEHTTWFAKKVTLKRFSVDRIKKPEVKKTLNNVQLASFLNEKIDGLGPVKRGLFCHNVLL